MLTYYLFVVRILTHYPLHRNLHRTAIKEVEDERLTLLDSKIRPVPRDCHLSYFWYEASRYLKVMSRPIIEDKSDLASDLFEKKSPNHHFPLCRKAALGKIGQFRRRGGED